MTVRRPLADPRPSAGDRAAVRRAQAKVRAPERAGTLLTRPRLQRRDGAVHDVPPQWPALVAGLVRAARAEVAGRGAPVPPAPGGEQSPA